MFISTALATAAAGATQAVAEPAPSPSLVPPILAAALGAILAQLLAHCFTIQRENRSDERERERTLRSDYLAALDRVVIAATETSRLVDMLASNAGRQSLDDVFGTFQAHLVEASAAQVFFRIRAGTGDELYRAFRDCGVSAAELNDTVATHLRSVPPDPLIGRRLREAAAEYARRFQVAVELMDERLAPGDATTGEVKVRFEEEKRRRGRHRG